MHVLKIHDVKLDFGALAIAMGNGELAILFVCSCYVCLVKLIKVAWGTFLHLSLVWQRLSPQVFIIDMLTSRTAPHTPYIHLLT